MEGNGKQKLSYANGQIYKLVSDHTDKIYIGSTCRGLRKRLHDHKNNYKLFCAGKYHNVTSFDLLKLGEVDIILIENYPCKNKKELHARERYWIEQNKMIAVNKIIPTRTDKEYREDNKEKIQEDNAKYRKDNKQKIQEDNAKYRKDNKEAINKYRKDNKEAINKYKNKPYVCCCGGNYTQQNKSKHLKTQKHQKYQRELINKQSLDMLDIYNNQKQMFRKLVKQFACL